jgi:hypothetical protein
MRHGCPAHRLAMMAQRPQPRADEPGDPPAYRQSGEVLAGSGLEHPAVGPVVQPLDQAVAALREQATGRGGVEPGIACGMEQRLPAPAVEGGVQQRCLQHAVLQRPALSYGLAHPGAPSCLSQPSR